MKTDFFAKCYQNEGDFADVMLCLLIPTATHSDDDVDRTLEVFKQVEECLN